MNAQGRRRKVKPRMAKIKKRIHMRRVKEKIVQKRRKSVAAFLVVVMKKNNE